MNANGTLVVNQHRTKALVLGEDEDTSTLFVITGRGFAQWPVENVKPCEDTTGLESLLAAAKAKYAAVDEERSKAETALAVAKRKRALIVAKIAETAHHEGSTHGTGPGLDELLIEFGMPARPLQLVLVADVHLRYTANRSVSESYAMPWSGASIDESRNLVIEFWRSLQLPTTVPREAQTACACSDVPSSESIVNHVATQVYSTSPRPGGHSVWEVSVLDVVPKYTVNRHHHTNGLPAQCAHAD